MKRLDDGKVSLVEFLRSIKFAHNTQNHSSEVRSHFAGFVPRARSHAQFSLEDSQLIRSAN